MFVDTHLHIIDKSKLSYRSPPAFPRSDRDFPYSEYELQARRAGSLMSCIWRWMSTLRRWNRKPRSFRISQRSRAASSVALQPLAGPNSDDFAAYLERQLQDPFVKGFRRVLHVMPDDLSESPLFRDNIRRMNGKRLSFDLVVQPPPDPARSRPPDLAPDTRFILDHCGVPDIKQQAEHPWRENIAAIARRPNVTANISAIVAYPDNESWSAETLRPYAEGPASSSQVSGWDRIISGESIGRFARLAAACWRG